jgi:ATP:ADP antiporter, AAA family
MAEQAEPQFSRLRSFLWPVHAHEMKKLIPMLLIFFLICFNYNILKAAKDALVVTAKGSGAQVIPFIKTWVTLPGAFLLTLLFTRLNNRFRKEQTFYIMSGIFLGFFALFITVLHPFESHLHPEGFADKLTKVLPSGFSGLIAMIRNWTLTAFYVVSDLWSSIMLQLLFWGFANDVTTIKESKRFYGIFGIGANFSGVVAGEASVFISSLGTKGIIPGMAPLSTSLTLLCGIVVLTGIAFMGLFRRLNTRVIQKSQVSEEWSVASNKKPKKKLSMRENFACLAKSKYLLCIAIIVLAYNISINLVEVLWKDQVRLMLPDPVQFNAYMGRIVTITSLIATITAVFVSGNVIRRFGWRFSALIPPVILLVTAIGFFGFVLGKNTGTGIYLPFVGSISALSIAVFFGSVQNCLSRAAKYTLFDPTKEMTFIPLSPEDKLRGKAAIDGVGSRLGKSGGSLIYQVLFITVSSSMAALTPIIGVVVFTLVFGWMGAVNSLSKRFKEETQKMDEQQQPEEVAIASEPAAAKASSV